MLVTMLICPNLSSANHIHESSDRNQTYTPLRSWCNSLTSKLRSQLSKHNVVDIPVNSKLDWNDNLAAIFEAKVVINRLSSSVLFYCFSRRG